MTCRSLSVAALFFTTAALAEDAVPADPRPEAPTIGILAGWTFPQSILEPNTVGVRFRLARVTLEPSVRLGGLSGTKAQTSTTTFPNQPVIDAKSQDVSGGLDLMVGVNTRHAVASRGPVDLIALAGASAGFSNQTTKTEVTGSTQVDRQTRSGFSAGLSWGFGLEWFLGHGVSLSADAQNPLVTFSTTKVNDHQEQPIGNEMRVTDSDTTNTTVDGALTFRPTVRLQLCLYY